MTRRTKEQNRALPRDLVQLASLVAVLNNESNWRGHWNRLLPRIEPPAWAARSPLRRISFFGTSAPPRLVRHAFRRQLLEFLEAWRSAGEKFKDFWENYPSLVEKLRHAYRETRLELLLGPDEEPILAPIGGPHDLDSGVLLACWEFIDFLENSLRSRLGNCANCGKYYLASTAHVYKFYCSPLCRARRAPKRVEDRKRSEESQRRLDRILEAYDSLTRSEKPVYDWKGWVASQAGVHRAWLSRALREGILKLPTVEREEGRKASSHRPGKI